MPLDPNPDGSRVRKPALTVKQTATGYWAVQRGGVQMAVAMTREAAERERETLERLRRCSDRRAGARPATRAS